MGVRRYKTAHLKGYFLNARAILDIFFEFAPVMEYGRKIMRGLFYIFSCSLILEMQKGLCRDHNPFPYCLLVISCAIKVLYSVLGIYIKQLTNGQKQVQLIRLNTYQLETTKISPLSNIPHKHKLSY